MYPEFFVGMEPETGTTCGVESMSLLPFSLILASDPPGRSREGRSRASEEIAPGLSIEDTGDAVFLVSEGDGHDLTLSLEPAVALRLAKFILSQARHREQVSSGGPG